MPLGSNKLSLNKNKLNAGSGGGEPLSLSLDESVTDNTITYTVTTNLPAGITLYYTTTGNAVSSDFTDNTLTGNFVIDASGGGTFDRTITTDTNIGLSTENITFAINIVRSLTTGGILAEGANHVIENIVPLNATASAGYNGNVTIDGQLHKVFVLSDIDANSTTAVDTTSSFNIIDLGTNTNSNIEILLVGGGGGAGLSNASDYQSAAGAGGGGDSLLQTIPVSTLAIQSYVASTASGGAKCANSTTNVVADSGNTSTFMGYTVLGGSGGHNTQDIEPKINVSYPYNYIPNDPNGAGYRTVQGGNGGDGAGTHGGGAGGGAGFPYDHGQGPNPGINTKGGNGGKPSTGGMIPPDLTRNTDRNNWYVGFIDTQGGTDGRITGLGGIPRGEPGSGCPGNLEISHWYVGSGTTIETNTFTTGNGSGGSASYWTSFSAGNFKAESGYPTNFPADRLVGYGDGGGSWKLQGQYPFGPFTTSADSGRNGTVQVRYPVFNDYRQLQS